MASAIDFKKLNYYCPRALEREGGKNLTPQAVFHYTPSHIFLSEAAFLNLDGHGHLLLRLNGDAIFEPRPQFSGAWSYEDISPAAGKRVRCDALRSAWAAGLY